MGDKRTALFLNDMLSRRYKRWGVPVSLSTRSHFVHKNFVRKEVLLAWCAGVFEGEGCVTLRANTKGGIRQYPLAAVAQKDRRLLDKFQLILGFGKIYKSRTASKCYYWQVTSSADVLRLYEYLAPYIGPVKEKQFSEVFIKWINLKKQHGRVL